jgi:hypothetical protein
MENKFHDHDEHIRGLKGHESIAQALAGVYILTTPSSQGVT